MIVMGRTAIPRGVSRTEMPVIDGGGRSVGSDVQCQRNPMEIQGIAATRTVPMNKATI